MEHVMHHSRVRNISDLERSASVVIGGTLALFGLRKRSGLGYASILLGAEMIRRGITGHSYLYEALGIETADKGQGAESTSVPYGAGIRVDWSVTVNKPRAELYRYWHQVDHLPRFMKNVESIMLFEPNRSHWVVRGPMGAKVEWDAEIINEVENERIGWRSVEGSEVDNAGAVVFKDAPTGRGTEVSVHLLYNPPAGLVGAAWAKLAGADPEKEIKEDMIRFKELMETGRVITVEGQTSGRKAELTRAAGSGGVTTLQPPKDKVTQASELSFPASDPPAY
jgi:uncharacterized membrane protein